MKLKVRDHTFYKPTRSILDAISDVLDSYSHAVSLRQVFYRLVALEVVENTPENYGKVGRICTDGRYSGCLDWDKIEDETRGCYGASDWEDGNAALEDRLNEFRLDWWKDSPYHVELWMEKRGMLSSFLPVAEEYHVQVVTCGGTDSTSNIWEAVCRLSAHRDKDVRLLGFFDLDPTGDWLQESIPERLSEFAEHGGIVPTWERVLLNLDQAEGLAEGTLERLGKDPRAKRFEEKYGRLFQIELDAVEPDKIERIVREAIEQYVDIETVAAIRTEEMRQRMELQEKLS